jgi:anti-anti-sigma factor
MRRGHQGRHFEVAVDLRREPPRVIVRGEIDMAAADRFEESLAEALAVGAPLVIDLRDTTFIDSTGISALVRVANFVADPPDPAQIILEAPQAAVLRTLTIVGIDRLVTIREQAER